MPLEDALRLYPRTRRFDVVRVLGTGGMGVVYEAVDRDRKTRIALKTLRTLDAEALIRFKREFRALQDIQHPNLVSLGELFEEEGQLYFTMELVRGIEFIEYIRPLAEPSQEVPSRSGNRSDAGPTDPARGTMRPPVGRKSSRPPPRPTSRPPPRHGMRPPIEATLELPSASRDRRAPWNWLVRHGHSFDEPRLRAAFAQLARGIQALHLAQKIHRDIKPSNVLVTEQGRVVILDFGLIADVEQIDGERLVVGTAHFMAPEQAAARDVGPEADWYSMGAMLYVALTGYYPFQLAPEVALEFKQCVEPTPPNLLIEGLPTDLTSLCVELLRLEPSARPAGEEVLRILRAEENVEDAPLSSHSSTFIGRWRELEALDKALAEVRGGGGAGGETAVTVMIEGESGMGKSALVRRFIEQFAGDALVLSGRCYERESVPYKAVDEIIDALSYHLARLPPEQLSDVLPENARLLANVFPVLRRVAPALEARADPGEAIDPLEVRALIFTTLRELLRRLAARKPVVISIDDLQWADADGLALLSEVIRPPDAPKLLLVATLRTYADDSHVQRSPRLAFEKGLVGGSIRSLPLGRLLDEEARQLAKLLLRIAARRGMGGAAAGRINIDALVQEAGGHPLFLDALIRHRLARSTEEAPVRLDDALWSQIQRLDAPARRLLELVAVAGGPVRHGIAASAVTADFDELTRLITALRMGNLVSTSGAGRGDFIETFHDRIRETVQSRLDAETQRVWHGRLALALEASGNAELERLAVHWRGAGDVERAAGYAVRAADQAVSALAFDRAAALCRLALDLSPEGAPDRVALLIRLGDALSSAGRSAEAAEEFLRASAIAPASMAIEQKRRAAENFLRSGYFDEGMACLRDVLAAIDMDVPETPSAALTALLFRRTELRLRGLRFEERPATRIASEKLTQIDICWSAALGLGMVDHIRGAYFQTRHLLLALRAGEPYRVARALALDVPFIATGGGPTQARVGELLEAATLTAERTNNPHAMGVVPAFAGLALYFEGRFREALVSLDRGESILRERCANVSWERSSALGCSAYCLWFLGDLRGLSHRVPLYLREAEDRGDRYLATNLASSFSNAYWLVKDEPEEAQRRAEDAIRTWSRAGFHLQHFYDMIARAQIGLYQGDDEAAHRYVMERWPALEASLNLRIQLVRIAAIHLRARTALGFAQTSRARPALLEVAAKASRDLESESMPWSDPLAALARAGVAATRGDVDGATAALAKAIKGFRAAEMELYTAAARRRFGELLGGDKGAAMVAEADKWMRERGVVKPARMTAMLAPGF